MGTIVRLTENSQKSESIAIGCFSNIYASVANMGIEHFRTEACKQMLLYPKCLNQENQNLMLRLWDNDVKCFMCPNFESKEECGKRYSNFKTKMCSCGKLISEMIYIDKEEDLKVQVISSGLTLDVLKVFGYANCEKLVQKTHNVNCKEFVTLLESLFASDTALTDTFLENSNSYGVKNIHKTLSPAVQEDRKESKDDRTIKLNACVKKEGKILYVECGEDFVDLLFSFLAMPLESIGESSSNRIIANICRNFKKLSVDYERDAKYVLPYYYKCRKQLLDVVTTPKPPAYYRYVSGCIGNHKFYGVSENSGKKPISPWEKLVPMLWVDPKSEGDSHTTDGSTTAGFVKRGIKFMVSDDLSITLSNISSTIGLLKEKQIHVTMLRSKRSS